MTALPRMGKEKSGLVSTEGGAFLIMLLLNFDLT